MRLRSRFALPPLDSRSALPLALAVLLAAALALQAAAGAGVDPPDAGAVQARGRPVVAIDRPSPAVADPVVAARAVFTPVFAAPKEAGADTAPLAGIVIAGTVTLGRATFAVVQGAGGRTYRAGPGDRVGAWRVRNVTSDAVLLERGRERMRIDFGPTGPVTTIVSKGNT